jgi:hypothetical protein
MNYKSTLYKNRENNQSDLVNSDGPSPSKIGSEM